MKNRFFLLLLAMLGLCQWLQADSRKVYNFNLEGLDSVEFGNKDYQIIKNQDGKYLGQSIITDLGDGKTKTTYINQQGKSVSINNKDEIIKNVGYYGNGTISSYSNDSIMVHFDQNGKLTEYWDMKN